ncbi:MAG TPA: hypothetical protein VF761_16790 [Gemmatimonadaceae bacterium]
MREKKGGDGPLTPPARPHRKYGANSVTVFHRDRRQRRELIFDEAKSIPAEVVERVRHNLDGGAEQTWKPLGPRRGDDWFARAFGMTPPPAEGRCRYCGRFMARDEVYPPEFPRECPRAPLGRCVATN